MLMGVARFNFLMEYVSGRVCMHSYGKCRSSFWTCTVHCCVESWNHHRSSTRKGCQYVLVTLNTRSVDGQFLIQTATHSLALCVDCFGTIWGLLSQNSLITWPNLHAHIFHVVHRGHVVHWGHMVLRDPMAKRGHVVETFQILVDTA